MIKTIIIDDEQHCIDSILRLIKDYEGVFNVLGSYTNIEEGLVATRKLKPNLVFLDVEINNQTGFDFLERIDTIDFHVVFTTAYEKYAVRAFRFSALDYLLKPIDIDDFKETVYKIREEESRTYFTEKMNVLFHNLKAEHNQKRIGISTIDSYTVVTVSDILYCKADKNYTDIFLSNGKKIETSKTLKRFETLLQPNDFYRVDQSFLVNLKHVKKYTKGKPAYAIMANGARIKVSIRSKDGFLKQLLNLM